jgi:hypothetical protein
MGTFKFMAKQLSIVLILFIAFGYWLVTKSQEKINNETASVENSFAAKHGPEPLFNEFNGSYFEVAEYLQQTAVNPDSVKIDSCTNVKETDKGWFVRCKYSAQNKLGAVAEASNGFYISNKKVVLTDK